MTVEEWLGKDNQLGIDIWHKKYQYKGETFEEWLDRVSGHDNDVKELIRSKKFLFGGRILAGRGITDSHHSYSNCYVIGHPEDSLESIFETAKKLARTYSFGGGCGIDLSHLAPKGAKVRNAAEQSSGAVSFMDLYSLVTGLISQNGRRGALMLSMSCTHPDIEEFIDIKNDLVRVTKANISVRMTDAFMKAAKANTDVTLSFARPETGETFYKVVNARELMKKLAHNNWDVGEPGILFWDNIRSNNFLNTYKNFEFDGTNPCLVGDTLISTTDGEIPIRDLVGKTPDVYCMDYDGNITISKAKRVWQTRKDAELVQVKTHRGKIVCTPEHLICTQNRGWVAAESLHKGDKLVGLNRQMKDETHVAVGLSGGKYVPEHRLVAGYYYNIDNSDVHHVDGNTSNNVKSNLEVVPHCVHSKITNTGRSIDVARDDKGRYVCKEIKHKRESLNLNCGTGTNWFVESVEHCVYREDVYDMTVENYHNFVANRIVVHNCGEEPLPAYGSCLLGSINLAEFANNGEFNFAGFEYAVRVAVEALNDVLEEGLPLHPLQEQRDCVSQWRQIGLGIMGLADALIKLGYRYGSRKAIVFSSKIAFKMLDTAVNQSALIAQRKGSFEQFDPELTASSTMFGKLNETTKYTVEEYGMRNSQLLTIAPTGTLSTMIGVSGGIEPIFANYYMRKTESLHGEDVYYKVYTPIVQEYMDKHGIRDDSDLPDFFVTSEQIPYTERIAMQSAWQEYIDASISSTVNLPYEATEEDVYDLYMKAWESGLKGITVFRSGCRRAPILSTTTTKEKQDSNATNSELSRGEIIATSNNLVGKKRKLVTGCGSLHCEAFFDPESGDLLEVFLSKGSTGGCLSNQTGLSRMMSLALRSGCTIQDVVDQLESAPVCPSYAVRTATKHDTSKGVCCPSAVAKALMGMWNEMQSEIAGKSVKSNESSICFDPEDNKNMTTSKCPECGEDIVFEGGCNVCKNCGWSKCS